LDEWRWRRDVLTRSRDNASRLVGERLRVLDYLINRYRDSPEAQRPVSVRPKPDFQVNDRAIVVLHHIWNGRVGGVKTPQEAKARVSTILERIVSHVATDESEPPGIAVLPRENPPDAAADPLASSSDLGPARESSPSGKTIVAAASPRKPSPPNGLVSDLYLRIVAPAVDDVEAAQLLVEGRSRIALNYVVYAWRELTASHRWHGAWNVLNRFLATPPTTTLVIQRMRESLAHDSAYVRMAALGILGRIGALEDIALLNDLLALPAAADEHPAERDTLVRSMWMIAKAPR
jgi:hypothetical protein